MINNLSLGRSRKQYQQDNSLIETTFREQGTKSFIQTEENSKRFINLMGQKLSCPLLVHYLQFPTQLPRILSKNRIVGYADELYWIAENKDLNIWHYTQQQPSIAFETKIQPKLIKIKLESNIVALNYIKSPIFSFFHKKVAGIFVIAFESYIELFLNQNGKIQSLNIKIAVNQKIQHIIGDQKGNIFYVGDSGIVKQLQNQSLKKTKFKNINGLNILKRLTHNISWFGQKITVRRIIINQSRNRLHCLLIKQPFGLWKNSTKNQQNIEVQTYVLNELNYHHKFNNNQLYKQLIVNHHKLDIIDKTYLKIADIYLTEDNLLGLVLRDGTFVKLINTRTLVIGTIQRPINISKINNVFLQRLQSQRTFCQYEVNSSFGQGSLSQLSFKSYSDFNNIQSNKNRKMIAYISPTSFDYSFNCPENQNLSVFPKNSLGLNKFLKGTIFSFGQQFICFSKFQVMLYKRFSPLQTLLIILNFHYEAEIQNKILSENIQLLDSYLKVYPVQWMCTYLIEIICSRTLKVEITTSTVYNTKMQIYKKQNTFKDILQINKIDDSNYRIFTNSPQIRQLANKWLRRYEMQIIGKNQKLTSQYQKNFDNASGDNHDVLWSSLSNYFNQLFNLIKQLNMRMILKQKGLIYYTKQKMNIFKRFLRKKLDEQINSSINFSNRTRFVKDLTRQQQDQTTFQFNYRPHQIPQNLTSNLIVRLAQNIDIIIAIINAFEITQGAYFDTVTLGQIVNNYDVRKQFADTFFKNIGRDHPVAIELVNKLPELITYLNAPYENQYYQQQFSFDESKNQMLHDLCKILDNYIIISEDIEEFQKLSQKNPFQSAIERIDMTLMRQSMNQNITSLRKDSQTFEYILNRLINASRQHDKTNLFRAIQQIKRSQIAVYIQTTKKILRKEGMIDLVYILESEKREQIITKKQQIFKGNKKSIFDLS